jgi:aryl-alcohol dehydrogenase-like predicted oxidoreductase
MQQRSLGKTGILVSPITIGAWQLGGPLAFDGKPDGHPDPGKKEVIRLIHTLQDLGLNAIDTAEQYSAGESERRVGEALKGRRDQWVISTKFGYRVGPNGTRDDDASPATIFPSLEGSLKRLRTDVIDIFLYHCEPASDQIAAGRELLEKAKQQGKIRAYGISTENLDLVQQMVEQEAIEVLQTVDNLVQQNSAMWEIANQAGLGTQLRGVMAQGRLSGKYFKTPPALHPDDSRANWFTDDDFTRYAPLGDLLPEGLSMAQAAIRWLLDHPNAHTICMGAKCIDDYRIAIQAVQMPPLSKELTSALEMRTSELR